VRASHRQFGKLAFLFCRQGTAPISQQIPPQQGSRKIYQGKGGQKFMKLHEDCIFVQLDNETVVFDHKRRKHFTPVNDSARIILTMLTANAAGEASYSYDDMVNNLIQTFGITNPDDAKAALDDFLNDLRGFGLLKEDPPKDHDKTKTPYYGKGHAQVIAGGTFITVGAFISWYWG
jgi:hypothetical protein